MKQSERSRRSRSAILEAALELFSQQGFGGTTVREIADAASVSTGSVYHQFPDKEAIFRQLLEDYWQALGSPEHPVNQALAGGAFPERLEELGRAARQAIERFKPYITLIYVDVVEFDGAHIRKFYAHMSERFGAFIDSHADDLPLKERLRPEVSPVMAMMLSTRVFLHFFAVEILFGVPNHYGKDTESVIHEIADMLRHGMLRETPTEEEHADALPPQGSPALKTSVSGKKSRQPKS